jgi:hypothetical protein
METVGVNLKLTKEFSQKLARHILALSERGIKTNKADLIVKLAEIGLEEQNKAGVIS